MARSLQELEVLELANEVRHHVQRLANRPSVQRDFKFAGQVLDCAGSVSRNIAEGFGHIRPLEFARFLFIARGSLFELREHLSDGIGRGYWTEKELDEVRRYARRTTGALNALIRYLRSEKAQEAARQWERRTKSRTGTREPANP